MKQIVTPLLNWYENNHRDLPWRRDRDPYHIWVSEIMLQQTRVEAVKGYYLRFIERLPQVQDLAEIEEEELLKLWEGLGYYQRVRNMQKAAKQIVTEYHCVFPHTFATLRELPGVGDYTAGAIASIAFDELVPAIDGNVLRVMMRLKNSTANIDLASTKKELFLELQKIMPLTSGIFNQALMELGALICLPNQSPKCDLCPLAEYCRANRAGTMETLPVRKEKKQRQEEFYTIVILHYQNLYAIKKRKTTGLLCNFYEYLPIEGILESRQVLEQLNERKLSPIEAIPLGETKHIFTHKVWYMSGYLVSVSQKKEDYLWVSRAQLDATYPLPGALQFYTSKLK